MWQPYVTLVTDIEFSPGSQPHSNTWIEQILPKMRSQFQWQSAHYIDKSWQVMTSLHHDNAFGESPARAARMQQHACLSTVQGCKMQVLFFRKICWNEEVRGSKFCSTRSAETQTPENGPCGWLFRTSVPSILSSCVWILLNATSIKSYKILPGLDEFPQFHNLSRVADAEPKPSVVVETGHTWPGYALDGWMLLNEVGISRRRALTCLLCS